MQPARRTALIAVILLAAAPVPAPLAQEVALEDVVAALGRDIQTAQRELSDAEALVSRERGELAGRINAAQGRVLDLRERAVAARRLADEETLSLRQIETRLETWQDQSRFQSRLLAGFLDRAGRRRLAEASEIDLEADLRLLGEHLAAQRERLYPTWQSREIVLESGAIGPARLLELGPVKWFRDDQSQQSGLVRTENDIERVSVVFAGAADAGIASLVEGSAGTVTFDPTLSRALLLAEDQETLLEHLRKGGIWVIPILAFALFASIIAAAKAVWLYRLPKLLPAIGHRVEAAVREGGGAVEALLREVGGPQAALVEVALNEPVLEQREDRLYSVLLEQRNRLERWLGAIAMTASVSPLLGLLGTVSGMIVTFRLMTLFGAGDAATVSAGISEALVTTELGLVVAIPALLAHALMSRKVKSYLGQLETDAVQLSQVPTETRES